MQLCYKQRHTVKPSASTQVSYEPLHLTVLNVHVNEARSGLKCSFTVHEIHFHSIFLYFQLPFLIAIFFHAGFVNLVTVSRYLPTAGLVWALRRFQVLAGRGLLGNIIWPAEHVFWIPTCHFNSSFIHSVNKKYMAEHYINQKLFPSPQTITNLTYTYKKCICENLL